MKKLSFNPSKRNLILIFSILIVFQALVGSISFKMAFNLKALQIVLGGILISVIISFPRDILLQTYETIKFSFRGEIDFDKTVNKIHNLAIRVRKDGLFALKEDIKYEEDIFIRDAMVLLNDYKKPEAIEDIMDHDIESRYMELMKPYKVVEMVANIAPAFGLVGTLVGMIGLLNTINRPELIMGNMAEALVSTLYGSLIANFLAFPIMARIQEYNCKKILEYRMVKEGILLIAREDTARNVFDKMNVMLREENRLNYPRKAYAKKYEGLDEGGVFYGMEEVLQRK